MFHCAGLSSDQLAKCPDEPLNPPLVVCREFELSCCSDEHKGVKIKQAALQDYKLWHPRSHQGNEVVAHGRSLMGGRWWVVTCGRKLLDLRWSTGQVSKGDLHAAETASAKLVIVPKGVKENWVANRAESWGDTSGAGFGGLDRIGLEKRWQLSLGFVRLLFGGFSGIARIGWRLLWNAPQKSWLKWLCWVPRLHAPRAHTFIYYACDCSCTTFNPFSLIWPLHYEWANAFCIFNASILVVNAENHLQIILCPCSKQIVWKKPAKHNPSVPKKKKNWKRYKLNKGRVAQQMDNRKREKGNKLGNGIFPTMCGWWGKMKGKANNKWESPLVQLLPHTKITRHGQ